MRRLALPFLSLLAVPVLAQTGVPSAPINWMVVHGAGTTAQRPAASTANKGYLYSNSTTGNVERSSGSAWVTWIAGGGGGGGSGTVTNTPGDLTSNAIMLGNGGADSKVAAGFSTNGTSILTLGVAGTSVGTVAFKNATSGTVSLLPPTGALGTYSVTLPNGASTLPVIGQPLTISGLTTARTVTFPDANFTAARTDAANTFTGTQTIGALVATTVNGNTFTTGTGVLTLGAGKTATVSNTLTFTGTDGSTLNIGTGGTLGTSAYLTLGANVGTWLTTPTHTNFAAAITGETGTGAPVFGTSPSITTSMLFDSGFVMNWNAGDVTLTHSSNTLTLAGGSLVVPTLAYDAATWNGNNAVPTMDAVRDKIETISAGALDIDALGSAAAATDLDADDKFVVSHDGTEKSITTAEVQAWVEGLSLTFSEINTTDLNVATAIATTGTITADGDISSNAGGIFGLTGQFGLAGTVAGTVTLKNATNSNNVIFAAGTPTGNRTLTAPDASGTLALTSSNVATATTLATPRAIYGNNFDGSAALTQIIASTFGGTGNGFTKFSGPATSEKTFTLPNSNATLLFEGGAIGGTTPAAGTFTTGVFGSTTSLLLGTAGSAVGNIGFRNATSGTATLAPPTGALGTYTVTLPNAASTLPIHSQQMTFTGPTAARTVTFPDANFTAARTDAANTFTGASTTSAWVMTSPTITTGIIPTTNDGAALGSTSNGFSDLHLATGALINVANGNAVITHSSGIFNVTTGDFRVTTAGTNAASVTTNSGVQTLSGKTLDAPILTTGMQLAENTSIILDSVLSADGTWTGTAIPGTAGTTLAFGDLVYLDPTDSRWELCDANSAAAADGDSRGLIGFCVQANTDGNPTTILISGTIRADAAFPTLTVGAAFYVSETAGDVTTTSPTTEDVVVRRVGFAITGDSAVIQPGDFITYDAP